MALTFEWDSRKARANLAKHGVAFEEAATIFGDARSLTIPDPGHSLKERRFVTMGEAFSDRLLIVVHISARRASRKERKFHDQEIS